MITVGIIGGGFSGTMCAVQLVRQSNHAFEILLFNDRDTLNTGIAYMPYSDKHLLNVITSKMSAFPDEPEHFLHWVMQQEDYKHIDKSVLASAFLPRSLFGDYLRSIWEDTSLLAEAKKITLKIIDAQVTNLEIQHPKSLLYLQNGEQKKSITVSLQPATPCRETRVFQMQFFTKVQTTFVIHGK